MLDPVAQRDKDQHLLRGDAQLREASRCRLDCTAGAPLRQAFGGAAQGEAAVERLAVLAQLPVYLGREGSSPSKCLRLDLIDHHCLDLPVQARAHHTQARLLPLHAGCSGRVHGEDQSLLIHEVTLDAEGAGIDPQHVATFVQIVCRNGATADITPGRAGGIALEQLRVIGVKGGKYLLTARGHQVHAHAQTGDRRLQRVFDLHA